MLGMFSAWLGLRWVIRSGEVNVPELQGKSLVQALRELERSGLLLQSEGQEFHPRIPANHIISQRPAAGARVKSGRKIRVIISKGPELIEVPDLVGESWYQAQTILHKKGLRAGELARTHSPEPQQQVLAQQPAPGASLKRGEKVNLLLSQGPAAAFYLMPDFIGRDLPWVRRRLKSMGLSLGKVVQQDYQGVPAQVVIDQEPAAGFPIRQGKLVNLLVSSG